MAKLLLVAPTCDPDDVGEAWIAFQWASRLAKRHDATVLTYRKRGRPPIAPMIPEARIVEWQEPPLVGRAERINSMLKPAYLPFEIRARRWIKRALSRGDQFDVAHQPAPVAMRYPSPLAGLGIPYVIGPVGGSLDSPAGFRSEDTAPWYVNMRRFDAFRVRFDPLLRRTYRDAACVLGIADYVRDFLGPIPLRRFEQLADAGIDSLPPQPPRAPHEGPLRLLYVGRVVRTKGVRDAIAAMGLLADIDVTLDVVGDGFDLAACRELATQLSLGDRVRFHGRRTRAEVDDFYRAADVFVFPSFREPGGSVVFEAMAMSLPLIVCARGGPASSVDDACGLKLTAIDPQQLASDLAAAIRALQADPQRRLAMGRAARERVAAIGLWDAKMEAIDRLYDELIAGR